MNLTKIKSLITGLAVGVLLLTTSCEIEPVPNPNNPTIESVLEGATEADLRLLASGLESVLRVDMQYHYWTVSIVGREYWDLNGVDPRFTTELLAATPDLDPNGFLTTRSFAARYKAVRNAENLITATMNANAGLSAEEDNAYLGFAETMKAYALLLELSRQFQNGIRLDVADPDNRGPFVGYEESLAGLSEILDSGFQKLSNAGSDAVPFVLSSGWDDLISDPEVGLTAPDFAKFNQAIAARVELYRGNLSAALDLVNKSFFDLTGDLNAGAYHVFGAGGNDIMNPLFNVPNNDLYIVHPQFLEDAEANDMRVADKTTPLDPDEIDLPVTLSGLSGDTQVTLIGSNTAPFPIIRNEELILIYAEANIGTDNDEAVAAIDIVRTAAGLPAYSGGTDDASLQDEVLKQRRYSLFGEGHRWIDVRRYGRLDMLPIDRDGDVVYSQFPRPVQEE